RGARRSRDDGHGESCRRRVLRQRADGGVLQRLLDGWTPGAHGRAALSRRLRRHRRRRARECRAPADVRPDLAVAGDAQGRLEPGSETGWNMSVAARPVNYAEDFFKYVVYNKPEWDPKSLNYDTDVSAADTVKTGLDATNADLSKFTARGGKLLIYHGWSDPG